MTLPILRVFNFDEFIRIAHLSHPVAICLERRPPLFNNYLVLTNLITHTALTAGISSPLFILRYEEYLGRGMDLDKPEFKELKAKAIERKQEIVETLKKAGFRVVDGAWKNRLEEYLRRLRV